MLAESVGGYVVTDTFDVEHTLRAIAICWPLLLNGLSILKVNSRIERFPHDVTKKNVFTATERCVFVQELGRLELVLKGPGFGDGIGLTSGRIRAALASAGVVFAGRGR